MTNPWETARIHAQDAHWCETEAIIAYANQEPVSAALHYNNGRMTWALAASYLLRALLFGAV